MAHILSVEDDRSTVLVSHAILRGRGHTVDEARDGAEGLRLARQHPYDVVVASLRMPEMGGPEFLVAVPMRPSGLPVRILQVHGGGDDHVRRCGGRVEFALREHTDSATSIQTVLAGVALAQKRAKAYASRSNSVPGGGPPRATLAGAGAPSSVPGHSADRWRAIDAMTRTVRVHGGCIRHVRWFPGPLAACLHLLEQGNPCSILVGPDLAPIVGGDPLREFNWRPERLAFPASLGVVPRWAAIERAALRSRLGTSGRGGEGEQEALLSLAYRGIGVDVSLIGNGSPPSASLAGIPGNSRVGLHQIWWWLLDDGTLVAADPPVRLALDFAAAPHSVTGPAIQYGDGFEVYAVHGRPDDAELIEHPERISIASIRAAADVELRRALRVLYGELRYLRDSGAQLIDMDTVPVDDLAPGSASLTRALLADSEGRRFLVSSDGSTSRVYHMRVPRSCTTCAEAYTALSGRPGVRTILQA